MKLKTYLTISVCAMLYFLGTRARGQDSGFHPEQQKTIIQRSSDYTVRLKASGMGMRVSIYKRGMPIGNFLLPGEMAQVDKIEFVPNNHAVLLGYANGDVNEVIVVDLSSGTMIDRFHCYFPALSPDKRFLAFAKFFPPHFVQGVSTEYMLYDFQKSPRMNRPSNVAPDDVRNVGLVIYPKGITNLPDDNVGKSESQIHMLESGEFFWSSNSNLLVFADGFQGRVSLIVARIGGPAPDTTIKEKELRKSDVCISDQSLEACSFGVASIQFPDEKHLKLMLRSHNHAIPIKPEIEFDL